ncbi:DUF2589 domain-containing protein [Aliarcobacter vitoriensis]|uniref:DUF2589 domain-containing protein n=1 Tax=Aliarcobacter vitoriensis TaxID=2011099 RepID=A0A366MNV4_9BACT|nr:DUF2589 domain-containing protein [Aliarcobacter vitoriensis]RBQ27978.1 hypothetical protein CRU91_11625 [Aliarcobacter vitoriensis]
MAENSNINSLNDIVISIAKSVAQAQSSVEESQLSHLFTFFTKKLKKDALGNKTDEPLPGIFPKKLKIGIPNSDDTSYKTKYYEVPYINLLPINQVHIEKITTDFDLQLVGIENIKDDEESEIKEFNKLPTLQVDIVGGGIAKQKGINAHISLTMVKHELPEGTARMINELINKSQGYTKELIQNKEEIDNVK